MLAVIDYKVCLFFFYNFIRNIGKKKKGKKMKTGQKKPAMFINVK